MFGQAFVYLGKYLIFLRISEFVSMKELSKPFSDTRKIQNQLTTVGSGKKKLQIETCHVAKVKAATSAHFIYF